MAQLNIKQRQAGDVAILDLDGEVRIGDSATALRGAIRELVAAGNKKILLNLGEVSYIDSSGIATLIEVLKDSQRLNKEFVLFGLSPAVEHVFRLTHVIRIFHVFQTEQEALGTA